MTKYLLDTSVYSQPLRPKPNPHVISQWQAIDQDAICTSIICHGELLYGLHKKDSPKLWNRYEQIFAKRIDVIKLGIPEIETFARLKNACYRSGCAVDTADLLIAATAMSNDMTVVTLNAKHFKLVPGLLVEDWSKQQ